MNSLIVCDDFITPDLARHVEATFLSHTYPWNYYANVNYVTPPPQNQPGLYPQDVRFCDSYGFSSLIFPAIGGSDIRGYDVSKMVLEAFVNKQGIIPAKLLRIKANLLTGNCTGNVLPFTPHVDLPFPHWVMIYYVNDSDGDTIILDKKYPDCENAMIATRISPKMGRAVLFDGNYYHCGTSPSQHDVRVVINYDYV